MWRDGEAEGAAGAATARRISPALLAFARNPFRLLRIPLSATTLEAGFAAERVLTLARAEMSSDELDPLPWLPAAGFPELQQAAQTVEEPLLRLKHQLLWFASAADPRGHDLAAALQRRDGPALADYLAREEPLPADGPNWLGGIANAINQANARLLLAAAKIDGLWPGAANPARPPRRSTRMPGGRWATCAAFPRRISPFGIRRTAIRTRCAPSGKAACRAGSR